MDKITAINNLFIKGKIDAEEYEALYNKYVEKKSGAEEITNILAAMNLEELLDTYKNADAFHTPAEAGHLRLLITTELYNRING